MRIRKYIASSIHEALRSMRRELGEDAIILSTRTLRSENAQELVEVLATAESELSSASGAPSAASASDTLLLTQLHYELTELRQQLRSLEFRLGFGATADPRWHELYDLLRAEGFSEGFLLRHLPPTTPFSSWKDALASARQNLTAHLRIAELPTPEERPLRLLVLGSPGAGKTTTMLKLLLFYRLSLTLPVWLIAADAYKLGALEQLQLFASIADIPLTEAYALHEVRQALLQLPKTPGVVAVDIPGGNPFQAETQNRWHHYCDAIRPDALLAVLSATDSLPVLQRLLQLWHELGVQGLIVTKLDQTPTLAPVLEALEQYPLPLMCLCAGPRIPDDLEPARPEALACRIGTTER
jgi:flagellar biosynthesis protein FlhF